MAVFRPSKSGDCMGTQEFQRFNKQQRRDFAIKKQEETDKMVDERFGGDHKASSKYRETIRKQRRDAGLED